MKVFIIEDECLRIPYLVRITLFEIPTPRILWRRLRKLPLERDDVGWSLKLHVILRSDVDRELHDHPWTFWTWMLHGGYWEHRPDGERTWIAPGTMRVCRAPYAHRLELPVETAEVVDIANGINLPARFKPAVTLVFMCPKSREWGFYTPTGWVQWRKYLGAKEC